MKTPLLLASFLCLLIGLKAQTEEMPSVWPSQMSYSGFINTPSAYTAGWGSLNIGASHFEAKAATIEQGITDERSFFSTIGILPQVEFTVRFTRPYNATLEDRYGLGDRSVSVRWQLLKEKKYMPALLIGTQDPNTPRAYFNTNYIVFTKSYKYKEIWFTANVGYGFEVRKTRRRFLIGAFGGVQAVWKNWQVIMEHDTSNFNIGTGYRVQNWLFLKTSLMGFKYFTGSISLRFQLKN